MLKKVLKLLDYHIFENKYKVRDSASYAIKVIASLNKIPEESNFEIKAFYTKIRDLITSLKQVDKLKPTLEEFTKELFETVVSLTNLYLYI